MVKWSSEALSIPITSLHIMDNLLLVGEGGSLHCYPLDGGPQLSQLTVFCGDRVHGVRRAHTGSSGGDGATEPHHLIVHGGRQLCLVSLDHRGGLSLLHPALSLDGWVLDVTSLPGGPLAALDAHGRLLRVAPDLSGQVAPPVRCPDRCILYSGTLVAPEGPGDTLLAFCGTVFCQVLIWAPGEAGDDGPILHRLSGHTGVIFRLTLTPSHDTLLSCSDDRSVLLWRRSGDDWRRAAPKPSDPLFGHEARVWAALPTGRRVASVGEDSRVCLWLPDGRLERRWRAHAGASIRAAVTDAAGTRLVTGGGDGAVIVWPLSGPAASPSLLPAPPGDKVRTLLSLDGGRQLVMTDSGRLLLLRCAEDGSGAGVTTEEVLRDPRVASYALMAAAPEGRRTALVGRDGHVITLNTAGAIPVIAADRQVVEGKIYSVHWLDDDRLLICGDSGQLCVISDISGGLSVTGRHQLPPCKQRWVSAAVLCPPETLVLADRDGSLHLFRPEQLEPVQTLRRLVGRYGATSITRTDAAANTMAPCSNGPTSTSPPDADVATNISPPAIDVATGADLLVTARDGTARRLCLGADGLLRQTSCLRLPWDWVAGVTRLDGEETIVGFHASEFVLWSVPAERELWRVDCGGGHRSWALSVSERLLWFTWVSEGCVRHVTCALDRLRTTVITPGIQGGGTLSAALLGAAPDGSSLLALAGQDCTVRLVSAGPGLRPLKTLRGHISAVRAVCAAGEGHLVSAGGRGQIILWRVTGGGASAVQTSAHMVRPERRRRREVEDVPETRYMDLAARREGETVTVAAAGSDGNVRVFGFSPGSPSPRLSVLACLPVAGRCLLRLRWLSADRLAVAATDGALWLCPVPVVSSGEDPQEARRLTQGATKEQEARKDQESSQRGQVEHDSTGMEKQPLRLPALHQSGINALEVCYHYSTAPPPFRPADVVPDRPADVTLLTGGDDGALCLSRLSADGRLTPGPRLAPAHASQVTGVSWLPAGRLLSVSVDQRLCVWEPEPDTDLLRRISCQLTAVADAKGLLHWTDRNGRPLVLVYGEGVELLRLEPTSPTGRPTQTATVSNS